MLNKHNFISLCLWVLLGLLPMLASAQVSITGFTTVSPCSNNGSITANVTGGLPPYSYTWSNNGCTVYPNSPTLSGLPNSGNQSGFSLTVTDANGASTSSWVYLPSSLEVYKSVTPANCPLNDGSVIALVQGGTAPFTYSWMNGATTNTITGLGQGDPFDVLVTDANGCTALLSDNDTLCLGNNMEGLSNMVLSTTINSVNCLNSSATISVTSGGTAPFSYSWIWASGQTTQTVTGLIVGNYYGVTVTDANGCSKDKYMLISNNTQIQPTVTSTPANCLNGTATVTTVTGGLAPYTYSWSNGQTTQTATGLVANQSYQVEVMDANSCSGFGYTSISSPTTIQAVISTTPETCISGNGTATVIASGGQQPYTYSWTNGQTSPNLSNVSAGGYSVLLMDANGCSKTAYVNVGQYSPIIANPSLVMSACSTATGTATLAPSGGTNPYTYYWNTVPPQVTATATGLSIGTHSYSIADAAGCVKNGSVQITDNSTMVLTVSTTPNACFTSNGTATANVTGGVAPFSYSWQTGGTTQTLSSLGTGWYQATVIDAAGCKRVNNSLVQNYTPVSISFSHTNTSCIFVNDGTATVNATGGTPPYTYQWANGSSTPTITNLLKGMYAVHVTDAAGCTKYGYVNVGYNSTSGCSVSISGNVFNDQVQDCIQAWNEPGIPNVMIACSPNGGYDYTDANGNYSFSGLAPGNYTLSHINNAFATQLCPTGNISIVLPTVGTSSTNNAFADQFVGLEDLSINAYNYAPPVTGNTYTNTIAIHNDGSVVQNPIVTCVHDANVTFLGANPSPISYNPATRTIIWNLAALSPLNWQSINVNYQVPTTTVASTVLAFLMDVAPIANDLTPQNNSTALNATVVSSYDPNYIEVSPAGLITGSDSVLDYVVHFQNTGTWPAQVVVVRQKIDPSLRVTSIQPGASSHGYEVNIEPDNTLVFTFDNINLPDSTSDEPNSHGFFAFTAHLNNGFSLPWGTQIKQKADIYFDFNAPVTTNDAIDIIMQPIGIVPKTSQSVMRIAPNPAKNFVEIEAKSVQNENVSIEMINVLGTTVYSNQISVDGNGLKTEINTSDFAEGFYIVTLKTQKGISSQKLLIVK